jgi:two-component system, cell cycle sensor histidine kinase and response regulator CckA
MQTNSHDPMLKPSHSLKAHHDQLQTTLANLCEAVVITDAAGGIIFMNAAAQALTGWESLVAQGRTVEEVVQLVASRDNRSALRGAVGVACHMAQSFDLVGYYLSRACDGMVLPIDGRATPVRDGTGTLVGAVWAFSDATADQQLAVQRQALLRERVDGLHSVFPWPGDRTLPGLWRRGAASYPDSYGR